MTAKRWCLIFDTTVDVAFMDDKNKEYTLVNVYNILDFSYSMSCYYI